MIVAISLIIALTVPILFLVLLRRYDLYQTGQFRMNIVTLIYGVIAYYFAAQINTAVYNAGWVTTWDQVVRFVAPFVEEILKSLILVYIVSRADFNYIVDGVLYGFGVGIGFAMIENIQYVTNNVEIAFFVAIIRVFSTNLMHATGSGLIGTALANKRGDKSKRAWLIILLGYVFSIAFHVIFNFMANKGVIILFPIAFGGGLGVGLIYYVIHRGMGIQKQTVTEKLTIADRAGKEDTKMVASVDLIDEALAPVRSRFGDEKAKLVRVLISKQAEIGIKRKNIENDSNEARKVEVGKIIENLVEETNILRNQIGTYCMMMVREVYLAQDIQTWGLLSSRVAASGTGQKGGGVWDRMTERVKESAIKEDES